MTLHFSNYKKTVKITIGLFSVLFLISGCNMKQQVDFIGYNGVVYTVDSAFTKTEAFAVKDGKFVEVGTTAHILAKYKVAATNQENGSPDNFVDFNGAAVYPGFNDSHCHLYEMGKGELNVNLRGATSFNEILERLQKAYNQNPNRSFLMGDGWDQNLWEVKEFPVNEKLNEMFPNIPVVLSRIDFHAVVANDAAIAKLGITPADFGLSGKYNRNEAIIKNGKFTGIFMENMCTIFKMEIAKYNNSDIKNIFLAAQDQCFQYGLTSISDAEEETLQLQLMDTLVNERKLRLKIDAWLSAVPDNFQHYKKPYFNKNLRITTLKLYRDGALGSRGATLLQPYSDDPKNTGIEISTLEQYREHCRWAYDHGFKVATHCIGDRANREVLDIYGEFYHLAQKGGNGAKPPLNWRIEHAQIIHEADMDKFKQYAIIPSVQPTHCTSDMLWADERLGERIKDAYRYKTLLSQLGWMPSGTDFPIEQVNPIYTFFAAVYRKNLNFIPDNGFQTEEALTKEEALRSMTIWGAKSTAEEHEKGSIEPGKYADFVITDRDFMTVPEKEVPATKVTGTYLNGIKVYDSFIQ